MPVSRSSPRSISAWTSTRNTISVGILHPDQQVPDVERIPMTTYRSAGSSAALVTPACCEPATSTGPTGFELARLLASKQVSCQVVAPSLIPGHR